MKKVTKQEPPIMHFHQNGLVINIWNKKWNEETYWIHTPREAIMKFEKKYGAHRGKHIAKY